MANDKSGPEDLHIASADAQRIWGSRGETPLQSFAMLHSPTDPTALRFGSGFQSYPLVGCPYLRSLLNPFLRRTSTSSSFWMRYGTRLLHVKTMSFIQRWSHLPALKTSSHTPRQLAILDTRSESGEPSPPSARKISADCLAPLCRSERQRGYS
ncbi:hypothetical protein M011DRAFT_350074 [Sporormia fimetaria CBS 119925]|uniref:Uncharacterized protein n=1 Tax=Sporormia fimetaria CBS 119925 TaxID=1340428 RepID=A0A6A6VE32_9PLEO|nr:hypothetical protein M011DRAFT_350074 [Sporormia fimetaria CBS 119925]